MRLYDLRFKAPESQQRVAGGRHAKRTQLKCRVICTATLDRMIDMVRMSTDWQTKALLLTLLLAGLCHRYGSIQQLDTIGDQGADHLEVIIPRLH